MHILSVIPYMNGYCGSVVVDDSAHGRHVIEAASIETSVLVDAVQGSRFNKKRELRDDVTLRLQSQVREMAERHGVERILLEVPPAKFELRAMLALAILSEFSGCEVEQVSSLWRTQAGDYATMRRENARSMVVSSYVPGTAQQLVYDSTLMAAALVSYTLDGIPDGLVKSDRKPREIELPKTEPSPAPIYDWRQLSAEPVPETDEPDVSVATHAGIDPGSRKIAVAIGDPGFPVTLRYLHTFEVGEIVQLDKPRTVELAGGAKYTISNKRVLTSNNVRALALEVVRELKARNVNRLTIEHVDDVHVPKDSPEAASGIATHLVRTMWVATEIAVRAELEGIEVLRVANATWRAKVAATASSGDDKDERILNAIGAGYRNWPSSTNEHERDAGGVLLHGELPEKTTQLSERNKTAALSPGRKRVPMSELKGEALEARKAKNREVATQRREERQAARREAGCKCEGKRHLGSCPLAKRSAKALAYLEANG